MRRVPPFGGGAVAVSAAEGRIGAAAAWIRSAWAPLPVARHYRLIASEALFGRAGLDRRDALGGGILAEPLGGALGPADRQIMVRALAGGVAAVVAFPNALAPAASRERLLALIEVAVRAGVPVAVEAMAASHLLRRLTEGAAHGAPPPDTGFPPDAEG